MLHTGQALDSNYFNAAGRNTDREADGTYWKSFIGTGSVGVINPPEASKVLFDQTLSRPIHIVGADTIA